jgi:hypothetical protein
MVEYLESYGSFWVNMVSQLNNDEVLGQIAEINDKALYPTDLEDAIIGYVDRFDTDTLILLDREKCLDILIKRDGMTREEAEEYFEYNIIGSWMGPGTPAFATILRRV